MEKDRKGFTALLYYSLENTEGVFSADAIVKLPEVGGQEVLQTSKTYANIKAVLHHFCEYLAFDEMQKVLMMELVSSIIFVSASGSGLYLCPSLYQHLLSVTPARSSSCWPTG